MEELVKPLIWQFLEIVGLRKSGKRRQQNHKDLKKELQKIWNVSVKIIPLVVGSLGAVTK